MPTVTHTRLDDLSLLRFGGEDARAFLHGQLTCDVANLPADACVPGAYCTPKGRALATFRLWSHDGGYVLQLPAALAAPILKRLSMYILRSKVRAADVSAEFAQHGLAGDGGAGFLQDWLGVAPSRAGQVVSGERGLAIGLPGDRALLMTPVAHAAALDARLAMTSIGTLDDWHGRDIADGLATVLPATQEQFVPQMLNLDAIGGVSFNKGCYPGQEIVARMHYLGRLKERLHRLQAPAGTQAQPGDKVYGVDLGEQAAGMVTNVARRADGTLDLLAVVQTSSVAAGPLTLLGRDGPPLAVETLPYALPSK